MKVYAKIPGKYHVYLLGEGGDKCPKQRTTDSKLKLEIRN